MQPNPFVPNSYLVPPNCTDIEPPDFNIETQTCVMIDNEWVVSDIPNPTTDLEMEPPPSYSAMEILRFDRDQKLKESDYRMLSDYTGSNKDNWINYRQALRDLPANSTPSLDENGQLTGVTWPTPPE